MDTTTIMVLFDTVISALQVLVSLLNAHKIETEEMLGNLGLVFLLGFIAFFIIIILIPRNGRKYLSTPIEKNWQNQQAREAAETKEAYEEWSKEQNFSAVLAGFAVSSLAFILAIPELSAHERVVEFFSFAFVLEMISFICFKNTTARGYDYLGTLLQFAGLLAFLDGFFTFIFIKFELSTIVLLVYGIGYIGFFVLSIMQLNSAYLRPIRKT